MSEWYGNVNVTPFDAWSFVHLASGVVAASMKTTLPTFIMLHTLFELIENTEEISGLMKQVGFDRRRMDTPANMLGDTVAAGIGWAIGNAQNKR